MRPLHLLPLLLAAPLSARQAVGRDDCADAALDHVFAGIHAFDTTLATTGLEGQSEGLCYVFGSSAIEKDVWFVYEASLVGIGSFQTCNSAGTHPDTKIAVYRGDACPQPGSAIGCSDDVCGPYSIVDVPVAICNRYLVQVGSPPGGAGGTGTIRIFESGPPPLGCYPDRSLWEGICGPPSATEGFEVFSGDTPFDVAPVPLAVGSIQSFQGVAFRNFVDTPPFAFNDNGGTNHASCFVNHDESATGGPPETRVEIALDPPARSFGADLYGGLDLEGVQLEYWIGEQLLDVCFQSAGGAPAFVGFCSDFCFDRVVLAPSTLVAGSGGEGCGLDELAVVTCGTLGASACDPAAPNSTGVPGLLTVFGTPFACWNNLFLRASDLPPSQFGYCIASETLGFLPNPGGSQGNICVLGNQARYNRPDQVGAGPTFTVDVGGELVPTNPAPGEPILPGQTWYFQCWYRDIGNTSNFTNAVCVTFL